MAHRINGGRKNWLKTTDSGINNSLYEDVEEDEEERALGQYPMSLLTYIYLIEWSISDRYSNEIAYHML